MVRCRSVKITNESMPLISGEMTQLNAMEEMRVHSTESKPPMSAPNPMMAPTMAWVVETGQPK